MSYLYDGLMIEKKEFMSSYSLTNYLFMRHSKPFSNGHPPFFPRQTFSGRFLANQINSCMGGLRMGLKTISKGRRLRQYQFISESIALYIQARLFIVQSTLHGVEHTSLLQPARQQQG